MGFFLHTFMAALLGFALPTSLPAQEGFAPIDLAADIDAARYLASQSELEDAIELLAASLGRHPRSPMTALGQQDLQLMGDIVRLRESHLAGLAKKGGKLRVEVSGKRRAIRIVSFKDGLVTFAKNRYGIDEIDATEISLFDLSSSFKSTKAGTPEVRAYALRLSGDKSWKSQWGKDEEGYEALVDDFTQIPASLKHGVLVLTLREIESYSGRDLGRGEGRAVISLYEQHFKQPPSYLEREQRTHLRTLLRAALVASWGLEELASGLNASEYQVLGEEIKLTYNFDDEKELSDWPHDESKIPGLSRLGVLRTPKEDWQLGLDSGFLQILGTRNIRHIVPFLGPMHLRYPVQIPEVGKPGGLWRCGVYLQDDLERSYLAVFGMGFLLQGSERGRPKEAKRDQLYYEVGKNYFVDVLYDRTGVLTVIREDKPEETLITLKTRKVDRGHISIAGTTDYLTLYDSIEIQGKPDLHQMDRFQAEWVIDRLATMGY